MTHEPSPLLDMPRVVCATPGCDIELLPRPDRRHVDNLVGRWICTACRRGLTVSEPTC